MSGGYRVRYWEGAMPGHRVSGEILPTPRLLSEGHRRVDAYDGPYMVGAVWGAYIAHRCPA